MKSLDHQALITTNLMMYRNILHLHTRSTEYAQAELNGLASSEAISTRRLSCVSVHGVMRVCVCVC